MRSLTRSTLYLLLVTLILGACSSPAPLNKPAAASPSPLILPTSTLSSTSIPTAVPDSPSLEPAVLRVVYFKDGKVMLWTEGKGSSPLAEASTEQLRISDDGLVAAYLGSSSAGDYGIHIVNADGTNQRLLVGGDYLQTTQPPRQIVSFDFSPASQALYFVTDQYDLHHVEAAGGSPAPIFGPGDGGFFTFSPDGQWMVLYHPNELVLAHPDGSEARVAFQYPPDFGYTMIGPEIVWEADSSGFYMVSASGPQNEPDSMSVWFIPVIGEPIKQMSYAGPYGAHLSPDGRKVAYLTFQQDPVEVHIVTPDGQDTAYNSYSTESYPAIKFMGWAPDSTHFSLNQSHDGRLMDPYLCAIGEQPAKLTDTDYAYPVAWVETERILFVSGESLRLQRLEAPSLLLDTVSSSTFDYTHVNP